jgi:superfamily II DNA/RNA helicase
VQSLTLLSFKHYNDFIIASQTGSGKTLAFGLPILSEILHELDRREANNIPCEKRLRALIIAPTRELAMQIE